MYPWKTLSLRSDLNSPASFCERQTISGLITLNTCVPGGNYQRPFKRSMHCWTTLPTAKKQLQHSNTLDFGTNRGAIESVRSIEEQTMAR